MLAYDDEEDAPFLEDDNRFVLEWGFYTELYRDLWIEPASIDRNKTRRTERARAKAAARRGNC